MPTYLTAFRHTSDTWAKLIAKPEDRRETFAPVVEAAGGKLLGYWYAFGEVDGYVLIEAPDDVTAASILVKAGASGALSISTTKLLTVDEALEAMRRAADVQYKPPGSGG
jgi:uncharacterized protein with GYD domain